MKSFSPKAKMLMGLAVIAAITGTLFTNCAKNSFTAVGEELAGTGADPLLGYAWHINNTGQKVFAADAGTAGVDLNLLQTWTAGLTGNGIKIVISDDGVQDAHPDLKDNFLYGVSKNYHNAAPYTSSNAPPSSSDDNHGTSVAGLAAAVGDNGVGSKGVAYKAKLLAYNFLSTGVSQTYSRMAEQLSGGYDVYNMSWGNSQNYLPDPVAAWETALLNGVLNGRSGKGSIYVKSAGNDFLVECKGSTDTYCIGNSNLDPDNSTPYTILVTALNSTGDAASYSSVGSNVWISSFGGESGDDSPAMVTTDRTGCSAGYAQTSISGKVEFERGNNGNSNCNYTTTFNGTSSAAPVLTGAIALLLEANPNLNWRDVKYILAKTAVQVRPNSGAISNHPLRNYPGNSAKNVILPSGAVWENAWVTNSAGFKFHNWYGFGRVNVDAAVSLAKNYTSTFTTSLSGTAWIENTTRVAIPDYSATGVSNTVTVTDNLRIEGVRIRLKVDHDRVGDLGVELTSPSGTKSMILNMRNSLLGQVDFDNEVFLSNAFFQERSNGTWTIKVIDGGSTFNGDLVSWGVQIIGTP
ncbi:S8 family peptidase [Bdellovibrio bacteriovorus]|uniref:S8 family peptidase n=1 Tax=Bdellovibrio bacteriovorus TaxID=959 RepID=UPI0035A5E962